MCFYGFCVTNKCTNSLNCPYGSQCIGDKCVQVIYRKCSNNYDCVGRDRCLNGDCIPHNFTCKQRKCLDGYSCKNEVCEMIGPACQRHTNCPMHYLCSIDGNCYKHIGAISCFDKVECPSKYTCLDNLCVPCDASNKDICQSSCSSDKDCNQNESCLEGHCIQTCSKQKCPESQICVRNHCYDDCKYGKSCPKGFYCVFGACLPEMPCSNKCRKGYWCLRLSKSKPTYVNSGNNAPTSGKNNNFQRQKLLQIWNSSARGRNKKD